MLPLARQKLISRIDAGESFEFFHFYGHTPRNDGTINQSCFSQWYEAGFEIDRCYYPTAEHWMMAGKARLFEDYDILDLIHVAPDPKTAKALGRKVRNFDKETWDNKCVAIVLQGNLAKFEQNEELHEFSKTTECKILVEASPRDRIWGIGMGAANENANNPKKWRGKNLLGFVLTDVRQRLAG